MNNTTKMIVQAGLIGAIYAVLTILIAPIAYGQFQLRVSEALTVLPFFTPAAIPGLFIGCLVANIYGGLGFIDIFLGSAATLIAAVISYRLRFKKFLVPFPPVIVNAIVVGFILNVSLNLPLIPSVLWVGLGQLAACYGLGYPLLLGLEKYKTRIFD